MHPKSKGSPDIVLFPTVDKAEDVLWPDIVKSDIYCRIV
jgi:hypothetical protein